MADKRVHSPDLDGFGNGQALVKRQRTDDQQIVIGSVTKDGIRRTSNLLAPTMQLVGHGGDVLSMRFSPDGASIASGSFDRTILLWRTYDECENYMMLRGHKNAVLEVHWFTSADHILSCSADKSVRCWDVEAGMQVKRLTEHIGIVNSCCPLQRGPPLFVSGSDDSKVKVWDMRSKRSVQTLDATVPVCAVAFSAAGDQVYSGGLDNDISVWELRKGTASLRMRGHSNTITGLRVSPDGNHLLSNSMDNTLRVWDMRPFAPANRYASSAARGQGTLAYVAVYCCNFVQLDSRDLLAVSMCVVLCRVC
eukprot:GHRR01013091.1.p1 GENE.GHRR01013091.1~~GHRR01013091.1.p1  ORF type:complete len:308 (+),score=57.93 GHRR01013091.1:211-1134(+)